MQALGHAEIVQCCATLAFSNQVVDLINEQQGENKWDFRSSEKSSKESLRLLAVL